VQSRRNYRRIARQFTETGTRKAPAILTGADLYSSRGVRNREEDQNL
jgi:hypothetical protein